MLQLSKTAHRLTSSLVGIALGLGYIFAVRFFILYSGSLLFAGTGLDTGHKGFYLGTLLGYALAFIWSCLRKDDIESQVFKDSGFGLALAGLLSLICAFLGFTVGHALLSLGLNRIFAQLFWPVGITLASLGVALFDMSVLCRLKEQDLLHSSLVLAGGFMLGALSMGILKFIALPSLVLWLFLVLALVGFAFFVRAYKDNQGPALESADHTGKVIKSDLSSQSLSMRDYKLMSYLFSLSAITGVCSALFGESNFLLNLRHELVLFAIIMASFGILALISFMPERMTVEFSFAGGIGCVVFALTLLTFFSETLQLAVQFVVFGAFFFALISSRAFCITYYASQGSALLLKRSAALFFVCQFVQLAALILASFIFSISSMNSSYLSVALSALALACALMPFVADRLLSFAQREVEHNSIQQPHMLPLDSSVSAHFPHEHASEEPKQEKAALELESHWEKLGQERKLTERELEVLILILRGRTRSAIAEELFISPHTVKTHTMNIYRKFEVTSKQDLITLCRELRNL